MTSKTQEELTTCRSGAPTLDGSNSSSTKRVNSSIGPTIRFLMSLQAKMKKVKQLVSKTTLARATRNGEFYILTKLPRLKPRDSTKNSVSISIDHSTSDQDFQCKELLNAMVLTTFG